MLAGLGRDLRHSRMPTGSSATSAAAAWSWSTSPRARRAGRSRSRSACSAPAATARRRARRSARASAPPACRAAAGALYLVGGSWRSLARMDMIATGYPLPILHQYSMAPERAAELKRLAASSDPRFAKAIAPARLAILPAAAMLLSVLVEELEPSQVVVSSFGIREGLLYSDLSAKERAAGSADRARRASWPTPTAARRAWRRARPLARRGVRRSARARPAAPDRLPARRRGLAGQPAVPRRPRGRAGAARQLGRGRGRPSGC